jgi:hypothetical protein
MKFSHQLGQKIGVGLGECGEKFARHHIGRLRKAAEHRRDLPRPGRLKRGGRGGVHQVQRHRRDDVCGRRVTGLAGRQIRRGQRQTGPRQQAEAKVWQELHAGRHSGSSKGTASGAGKSEIFRSRHMIGR